MGPDRTTEAIAHFIGFFDVKVDALRMRELHDAFLMKRAEPDLEQIGTVTVEIPAEYELIRSDHDPGTFKAAWPVPPIIWPPAPALPNDGRALDFSTSGDRPDLPVEALPPVPFENSLAIAHLHMKWQAPAVAPPLPGSMITVTIETAYLSDIDLLGSGVFRDPADSIADLGRLAAAARALHAPSGFGPAEVPDAEAVETFITALANFTGAQGFGFETSTLRGSEVPQMLVNGTEVDDLPLWDDLKPLHHRADEPDGEPLLPGWALPKEYVANSETPEGHSLITGGNLLLNKAQFSVSLVDAPLIAVGGTWRDIDVVSQVSAVSNHDTGSAAPPAPSSIYQTVLVETLASAAPWQDGRDMSGGGPSKLLLSVISGDLVLSNYVEQIIEVMDNDLFGMAIGGANTAYILGDNTVFNATNLIVGGMAFDLILVGGDFLTIDTIHQTQILLDDDRIDAARPILPAPANTAALDRADDAASGDPGSVWEPVADNLLMSEARLTTLGVDLRAELSDSLAAMLSDSTTELDTLKERLMNDPALAGLEQARVLKIDGDLIQMNTLKQTILASDRDDIRIDGGVPDDMQLVAGSNALLNAAAISVRGVDSLVMTREEGYSDLLIHQARLIDEPDFDGPLAGELASEAVAFLMEDTRSDIAQKMDDTFATTKETLAADNFDLMSGVLV